MIWLVWRRLRTQLLVAMGLVVLLAVVAVAGRFGWVAAAESQGLLPCLRGSQAGPCVTNAWYLYSSGLGLFYAWVTLALIALPGVTGALVGAGLFGGEMTRGTHVLALSQSVSRLRWFGLGLLVAGLPVALAVALLTPIAAWWANPFGNVLYSSDLRLDVFLTSGLVPAAYAILAFSVAAAAGLLLRNTVGALGLALAVQVGVLLLTSLILRPTYLPPERVATPITANFGNSVTEDRGNLYVGGGYLDAQGRALDFSEVGPLNCGGAELEYADCMARIGVVATYTDYQPPSRYWPFQAIESSGLLVLAGIALGAGLWGLRRRVH